MFLNLQFRSWMLIGMVGVQKYTILNEKSLNGMGHPKIATKN